MLIEEDTEEGFLRDAIYYSLDEFEGISEAELKRAKKARKDEWVKASRQARLNPPAEEVPEPGVEQ